MKIALFLAFAYLLCAHAAILPFPTPSATGTAGPTGSGSSSVSSTGSETGLSPSATGTGATGESSSASATGSESPSSTGTGAETGSTGSLSASSTGTAQPTGTGSGGESSTGSSGGSENPPPSTNTSNAAWLWAQETLRVLDAVKNSNSPKAAFFSPPIAARVLAIVDTAMYDAASTFMPNASSWSNFTALKINGSNDDINEAVSFAAYRSLLSLFAPFPDHLSSTTQLFGSLGYSPSNNSTLPSAQSPSAIGNSAAYAVLRKRSNDGTNQNGDAEGTPSGWIGTPYADYTNYFPVNDAQSAYAHTSCDELRDVNHWQPLRVLKPNQYFGPNITSDQFNANRSGTVSGPQCCVDRNGTAPFQKAAFSRTAIQTWLSPFMAFVDPFADWSVASLLHSLHSNLSHPAVLGALDSTGSSLSESNFDELLAAAVDRMAANLNETSKGWVDLWTNGINNSFAPSHWRHLALIIIADKNMTVQDTVKLLFAHSNAMFDSGVAVWTLKRTHDTARPISAIQCRLANSTLVGYKGAYLGSGSVNGSAFMPYSPAYVLSPAYGEYPSGSSAFAAASVRVLAYFLNDTALNVTIVLPAGTSSVEPKITDASNRYYRPNLTDVPANSSADEGYAIPSDQTLSYTSLADLQDQAMLAPLYAGLSFPASVADGRLIGDAVADRVLQKYTALSSSASSSSGDSSSSSDSESSGLPSNTGTVNV